VKAKVARATGLTARRCHGWHFADAGFAEERRSSLFCHFSHRVNNNSGFVIPSAMHVTSANLCWFQDILTERTLSNRFVVFDDTAIDFQNSWRIA
jgi:hypothetical protein